MKREPGPLIESRQRCSWVNVLCCPRWVWKQRIAVTRFLIAFHVRRVLQPIRARCRLALTAAPPQSGHCD